MMSSKVLDFCQTFGEKKKSIKTFSPVIKPWSLALQADFFSV